MNFQYPQIQQTFIVTALENTSYLLSKGWLSTNGEPRSLVYKTFLKKQCSSLFDQVIKITEYEKNLAILALKVEGKIPNSFGKSSFKDSTFYKECTGH